MLVGSCGTMSLREPPLRLLANHSAPENQHTSLRRGQKGNEVMDFKTESKQESWETFTVLPEA